MTLPTGLLPKSNLPSALTSCLSAGLLLTGLLTVPANAGTLLSIDFGQTQSPSPLQAGFSAFNITNLSTAGPVTNTYGTYTVRVAGATTVDANGNLNSTGIVNARNRTAPASDTGTFTYSSLYSGFVCSSYGNPLAVQISGLAKNMEYSVTFYCYDNNGTNVESITDLTGGANTPLGSTSWIAAAPFDTTTPNNRYSLNALMTSDSQGRITFKMSTHINGLTVANAPWVGSWKGGAGSYIEYLGAGQGGNLPPYLGTQHFEEYLGKPSKTPIMYVSGNVTNGVWWLDTATAPVWGGTRWQSVISVGMLPNNKSGSTFTYTLPTDDATRSSYAAHFATYAQTLVNAGQGNAVIRLGWEMNGNWYSWHVLNATEAANFKLYWQAIVTAMRAVPGANFKFNFCPSNGYASNGYAATNAYPGADYVDIIGIDVYDSTYVSGGADPVTRWTNDLNNTYTHGLNFWASFAADTSATGSGGKPMAIDEWADGGHTLTTGTSAPFEGCDDPYFIQMMADFIRTHNVLYHSYWDMYTTVLQDSGSSWPAQLSPVPSLGNTTQWPLSSALFQDLFGEAQWLEKDLGTVGVWGNSWYQPATGVTTVMGSGTGIGGTAESCHFSYTPKVGDCSVTAQITGVENTSTNAVAGVMIRESLTAANGRCAFLGITQNGSVRFSVRTAVGTTATNIYTAIGQTFPYWAKISRAGDTFTAYTSADGLNWTQLGTSQTVVMDSNHDQVYVGAAVSGITNTALNSSTLAYLNEGVEVIVDSEDGTTGGVTLTGTWSTVVNTATQHGSSYLRGSSSSAVSARFTPNIPVTGKYAVYTWTNNSGGSSANNVPVTIQHASGTASLTLNQKLITGKWFPVGIYTFNAGTSGYLQLNTTGTTQYVIADAVRFVKIQ